MNGNSYFLWSIISVADLVLNLGSSSGSGLLIVQHVKSSSQAWAWAARQARSGLKISGLGCIFCPNGRAWAAETRPDYWLGLGMCSIFESFWEGPARKLDGPTKNTSLGPGLGRFFRPDSQAGPGLGRRFLCRAFSWPGPASPRRCPGKPLVLTCQDIFNIIHTKIQTCKA
jgi:hypothetical protein